MAKKSDNKKKKTKTAITSDPPSSADKIAVSRVVKTTTTVNVRKKPKNSAATIAWLGEDIICQASYKQNGYYYIQVTDESAPASSQNVQGWIDAAYLKVTKKHDKLDTNAVYYTKAEKEAIKARKAEEKEQEKLNEKLSNGISDEQYEIYQQFINSQGEGNDKADTDYLVNSDLSGIYGLPYQFPETVDMRTSEITNGGNEKNKSHFGIYYSRRILERMPLLMMSPGRVDFMKGSSDSDKLPVIESLLSGGASTISEFLKKPAKYYSFSYQSDQYWEYVNTMNNACAIYLGIQDEQITINGVGPTALGSFKWEDVTNNKLDSYIMSSEDYVCFYCDATSTKNEDFSNSTTESQIASSINSYSDKAKEARFILGAATGAKTSFLDESNIDNITSKIDDIADEYLHHSQLFKDLGKDFAIIATGGKLLFPEIWSDSEFSQSFDVNIKLRCPCPNPLQWYLDIIVPLNHLIAFTMPRTPYGKNTAGADFGNTANGYVSPFLVRAFYKGLFNCDMGIVTSLSIQKGKEGSWTLDGLPSEVDVSMTIKDLYNIMVMTPDSKPATFISNTCFLNYIANSCGISINKPDIERSIDLYVAVYKKTFVRNITGYRFWKSLSQSGRNKMYDMYTSYFRG